MVGPGVAQGPRVDRLAWHEQLGEDCVQVPAGGVGEGRGGMKTGLPFKRFASKVFPEFFSA